MDYRLYTRSEKSPDIKHIVNEDSFMFSELSFMRDKKIKLLVVADGMGGLNNGKVASKNAVTGFCEAFYKMMLEQYIGSTIDEFSLKYVVGDIKNCLVKAIQSANYAVCNGAKDYEVTGTTISVVCVIDDCAIVANVGDSPIFICRKQEKESRLCSKLQTKAELDVEAGQYKRYSEEYYNNDHVLYCSLGQYNQLPKEDIYVSAIGNLQSGDSILVGSDGCFGQLNNTVIGNLLEDCKKEEETFFLPQLFSLALMDKKDDQTALYYVVA